MKEGAQRKPNVNEIVALVRRVRQHLRKPGKVSLVGTTRTAAQASAALDELKIDVGEGGIPWAVLAIPATADALEELQAARAAETEAAPTAADVVEDEHDDAIGEADEI